MVEPLNSSAVATRESIPAAGAEVHDEEHDHTVGWWERAHAGFIALLVLLDLTGLGMTQQ